MTDATTKTPEGVQTPSIFTQPVVPMWKARDELRPRERLIRYTPETNSSNLLLWAIMEALIEHKPKLGQAVAVNLMAALGVAEEQDREGEEAALLRGVIVRVQDIIAGLQLRGRLR